MTDPTFDPRLAARLQAYAQRGVIRIDSLEVAGAAIAVQARRRTRRPWLLLAAALLIGGAASAMLVIGAGQHRQPARSGSIVFALDNGSASGLWRSDVATGSTVEIAGGSRITASVSPEGGHVAWFDENLTDVHLGSPRTGVWAMVPAGGAIAVRDTPASDHPCPGGCMDFTFTWSPSGRWVSWAACTDAVTCRLIISASDGSQRTALDPSFPRSQIDHQAWLFWRPDDILRVKFADGRGFLEANADGTNIREITGPFSPDQPDGGQDEIDEHGLTVRRADGSVRWSVSFDGKQIVDVSWSPDGSRAVVGLEAVPDLTRSVELVDQDGHRIPVDRRAGGADWAAWSPDSSRAFVVTRVDGSSQVADGAIIGRTGQYISGVHDAMIAAWSPDSRLLAVGGSAENTITVMDADGSDRQRLIGPAPGSIDHLEWIP